jgi:hypothetical protein
MPTAISHDYGLSWSDLGQIITGTDQPTPNQNTGEGDCTVADLRPTTASDGTAAGSRAHSRLIESEALALLPTFA